jgi:hypothetical protein
VAAIGTLLAFTAAGAQTRQVSNARKPSYTTPTAMQSQHEYLNGELESATKLTGPVGDAARDVAKLLKAHFAREEKLALPPLALLKPLSEGDFDPEMVKLLPLMDEFLDVLPSFQNEHQRIIAATKRLKDAACANGNAHVDALADQLIQHAQLEEQVLYPAALTTAPLLRIKGRSLGLSI